VKRVAVAELMVYKEQKMFYKKGDVAALTSDVT
jgi:hypothetical protein